MYRKFTEFYSASSVFKSLFNEGDVIFLFDDDKKVNAIKDVLASVSPVFESMFFGDLKESSHVSMVDISYDGFSSMMKLIHGYEINELDSGLLIDTLIAADKYLIDSLKNDLCNYLREKLNDLIAVNFFDRIELNQMEPLIKRVEKYIVVNCKTIFFDELHIQLSESASMSILNVKRLEMLEMDLINGISKWIDAKLEIEGLQVNRFNKQQAFIPFKPFVRFCDLTESELMRGKNVLDNLLTEEEAYNILEHLVHETVQLNIKYEGDRTNCESFVYCVAETVTLPLHVIQSHATYLQVYRKALIYSICTNIPAEVKNLKSKIFESKIGRNQEIAGLRITHSLVTNKWEIKFPHLFEMFPDVSYCIKFEFTNTPSSLRSQTLNMFLVTNNCRYLRTWYSEDIKFSLEYMGHYIDRINFLYYN